MNYTEKILAFAKENAPGLYAISVYEAGEIASLQVSPANKTNNCYSVAKLFTVTALGLLWDEGLLSTEEKVVDIFKDETFPGMDEKWADVTVDMVMRHSFGIDRGYLDIDAEDVNDFEAKYGSRTDFLRIVFSARLPRTPGKHWCYSDAAYYLLSRVVAKKAGEDLYEYLRQRLFNPLGVEEAAWTKCPMGYSMGATGLYIRTADIAKLGALYLGRGAFAGKRILSEKWCELVLERGYELRGEKGAWQKGGMFGQNVYVDDNRRIAVAWQGYDTTGYSGRLGEFLKNL